MSLRRYNPGVDEDDSDDDLDPATAEQLRALSLHLEDDDDEDFVVVHHSNSMDPKGSFKIALPQTSGAEKEQSRKQDNQVPTDLAKSETCRETIAAADGGEVATEELPDAGTPSLPESATGSSVAASAANDEGDAS